MGPVMGYLFSDLGAEGCCCFLNALLYTAVYQYHTPPLRRLPPLIWVRIQDELDQYLITAGADGAQVITWYHRQFHATARKRYMTEEAK